MARGLTTAIAAEFAKAKLKPVIFCEIQFVSGWVRVFTGRGTVSWNGQSWVGIMLPKSQVMAGISSLVETTDVQSQGAKLTLSGVPAASLQQVLNETRQGFKANIYLGAFDQSSGALIVDPYRSWSGYTDVPTIARKGPTATIEITIENRLIDLQRPRQFNYTHEDQQIFSPGDLGFQYVGALQNFNANWGSGGPIAPAAFVPTPKQ